MKQMENLVPTIDWELGMEVWHEFFSFHHPISILPKPKCEDEQQATQGDSRNSRTSHGDSSENKEHTEGEPPAKKHKDPMMPSFRSTCYRSGKHIFQSPQAAASFGGAIQDYFGWNVNLKNHDIEVVLNIDGDNIYIVINLTRQSLHKRNLVQFGPTSLRPTLAYGMLRLDNY